MKKILVLFVLSCSLILANNLKELTPTEITQEEKIVKSLEEKEQKIKEEIVKDINKFNDNLEKTKEKYKETKEKYKEKNFSKKFFKSFKVIQYITNPLLILGVIIVYFKKRKEYKKGEKK